MHHTTKLASFLNEGPFLDFSSLLQDLLVLNGFLRPENTYAGFPSRGSWRGCLKFKPKPR